MIEIPQDVREAMVDHAFRELPNEACGLLAGMAGETAPGQRPAELNKSQIPVEFAQLAAQIVAAVERKAL